MLVNTHSRVTMKSEVKSEDVGASQALSLRTVIKRDNDKGT